jgi:hypothetical protein
VGVFTLKRMVRAVLICSDDECTAVFEAYGALEDVERLACECGCGLQVLGWPEAVGNGRAPELELTLIAA